MLFLDTWRAPSCKQESSYGSLQGELYTVGSLPVEHLRDFLTRSLALARQEADVRWQAGPGALPSVDGCYASHEMFSSWEALL